MILLPILRYHADARENQLEFDSIIFKYNVFWRYPSDR
jgi:hypothetical protein